ncbi:TMEM57 [Bugula neritina]|uniref:Macoilin n=1 Tax=Bugula neritina TaxID=10212 RepID=A0A7J7J7Q0_BUGNE|nr:TMEM57 [Bugula neritina]
MLKTGISESECILACLKFLTIWILVLLADFILEFRFEYLYPVWLLLRSVQDSYKYQGFLLTMLFLIAAIGTDVLCYILIPVQWLFFAASSYVWVQYVWHTDRGICASSILLWLLFVYVEAALRMKDQKSLPFNMDLCRPFAAHCIGYPVVTLGYGIKTAASESIRKRTRNKVQQSNRWKQNLVQEALPVELRDSENVDEGNARSSEDQSKKDNKLDDVSDDGSESSDVSSSTNQNTSSPISLTTANFASSFLEKFTTSHGNQNNKSAYIEDFDSNNDNENGVYQMHRRNVNDVNEDTENMINESKNNKVSNRDGSSAPPKRLGSKKNKNISSSPATLASTQNGSGNSISFTTPLSNGHTVHSSGDTVTKLEYSISRLESDVKKLKADLQSSRNTESELRSQLNSKSKDDRQKAVSLAQLQQDNDSLQNKLHNLVMSRQQDKQNLANAEKKLAEEKKLREKSDSLLASERKTKRQEEHVAARAVALANASRNVDCVGECKSKMHTLEEENSKLQWAVGRKDERIRIIESENMEWRRRFEGDPNVDYNTLLSRTKVLEARYTHMENTLREESRAKLSYYSAANEYKRQLDLQSQLMGAKDMEIVRLRAHINDSLALVPSSMYTDHPVATGQYTTPKLGSPTITSGPDHVYILQDQVFDSKPHPPAPALSSSRYSPTSPLKSESDSPPATSVGDHQPTAPAQ